MKLISKFSIIFLFIAIILFFKPFLLEGKLPIPSDTIIGLYHPFRDLYAKNYPNGIPFKNFLITDPVRQQIPWKKLVIDSEKKFNLPLWSPYNFAGVPLLANFQSAAFYPLNILFFLPAGRQGFLPFSFAWAIFILFQPILAGVFLFFYLKNLKLHNFAALLGSMSFIFSGFFISWLEWGTIIHTALWLPLILLCIDKIFLDINQNLKVKNQNAKFQLKNKKLFLWSFIFLFSLISSFFAGHLQTFFYLYLLSLVYIFAKLVQFKNKNILLLFIILNSLFLILSFIQWFPTLQFISYSARDLHLSNWQNPGWFIPWQHLIQFLIPDFFGNPATLNYWGVWNYGELTGYVGILSIIFAVFALFYRKDKKVLFFGGALFFALIFSLPTFFAKIPFILKIPFVSTAQPTRLLFIIDFSLIVLASLGFDYFLNSPNKKKIYYPLIFFSLFFAGIWFFVVFGKSKLISIENLNVAKQNLILPTFLFVFSSFILIIISFLKSRNKIFFLSFILIGISVFDSLRFGIKFTPFTNNEYLFPETSLINFLKSNISDYRIMSTDSRILPPNFSAVYKLQSVDGYDPLYLKTYGGLISVSQGGKISSLESGFGFDRIITPQNYENKIIDLLGVKYVLSLSDLNSQKLVKVFQEGETRVYENKKVLPRAFFVQNITSVKDKDEAIRELLEIGFDPIKTGLVQESSSVLTKGPMTIGKVQLLKYLDNKVIIKTENNGDGFLILTDSFYPTWKASIDTREAKIYQTDYNFRGLFVPKGTHVITFYNVLF